MKGAKPLLAIIISILHCLGCKQSAADPDLATVVNIADGDTFTLLFAGKENLKVRLYGIDSPERSQPYGTAARRHLGQLVEGHRVRIEERDRDRYGRTIAIAFRDDGLNINETMIRDGYAWHYRQYDRQNQRWSDIEADARRRKIGLWQEPNPTPPWAFRKSKRQQAGSVAP